MPSTATPPLLSDSRLTRWLLAPAAAWMALFFFIPLLLVLAISFATRGPYGGIEWTPTLENYALLGDSLYLRVYGRSLILATLTTAVCLLAGFPLAYYIARLPPRWQGVWILLVIVPFWTNFLVRTYAWMFILRTEGLLNTILLKLGVIASPIEILYSDAAVLIGLVYGYLPFMVLPLYAVLGRLDFTLVEAAWDLYASGWAVVWRIILPLAKPGVIAGCILVFIPTLGAYITPDLLGGARTMMVGNLIQHEYLVVRDWPLGSAFSFVLMAMVLAGVWWYWRVESGTLSVRARDMNGRRPWLLGVSLGNLGFLYAPIVVLILFSFNASRLSASWHGFTLHWYEVLANDQALLAAVQNSLVVAVISTCIATVLGVGAAVGMERLSARGQRVVEGTLVLPLVIPEVMMGVALMLFFVLIKWPLSLTTITIGHAAFNLPIVVVMVRARLRKLDPRLEEAARDLGATYWQAFSRVTLPLLLPAIVGAALMSFTISLDDFIVTFFTAGPGSTTLPLRVYSMIKSGISPEINALSAILVLLSMGLIGIGMALQRK